MKSGQMKLDKWIRIAKPNPNATMRLFCFPYAGGGASVYRLWQDQLPSQIEVCAIQLPGRENRINEKPFLRIQSLAKELTRVIQPYLDRPFSFFGHSMGSLIAYELTQQINQKYARLPQHLMVSARRAPHLPDPDSPLHQLPENQFLEAVQQRYNSVPDIVLQEKELRVLFIPLLRADFEKAETYRPTYIDSLSCPIIAFGGLTDDRASEDEMMAWQWLAAGDFSCHMLQGDHFYFNDDPLPLLSQIRRIHDIG